MRIAAVWEFIMRILLSLSASSRMRRNVK